MNDALAAARAAIDAAHENDPRKAGDASAEMRYADRLEGWIDRLVTSPSPALRLAARAQHLERWAIPRDSYPKDRGGYLRWRAAVHKRQGERAKELLLACGCEETLATRVGALVAKAAPREDPEQQALEDAACLVFLETDFAPFAAEYAREKSIDVVKKTWRKMSPAARKIALALPLAPELVSIVEEAVG